MSKRFTIGAALLAVAAAGVILTVPSAAEASATVTRFTFSGTETFADSPPECVPEVKSGVTNAVDTGSGQITETSHGYQIHVSDTFVYRTDFDDGSYLTGVAHGHFTEVGTGSVTVHTEVVREPRTIYSADGVPIGRVMIHYLLHTTTDNLTGDTSASIEKFFATCY
ncbi:hypothetical protein ACH3VR_12045 [Microbacterium sp. B2969]|uniref:Allene oxide cyclase barrel-like domain-containing protein n=1 Tax=Microbacterium alkaliflavum TaxID=3248839 RepID=A0ABW7Q895_9MICO